MKLKKQGSSKGSGQTRQTRSRLLPTIKKKLRDARVSSGMSQITLADKTGIPQTSISNWENLKKSCVPDCADAVTLSVELGWSWLKE